MRCIGSGRVADLHDSVLQTGGDEELLGLHVQDEVGPDGLREVLRWGGTEPVSHGSRRVVCGVIPTLSVML